MKPGVKVATRSNMTLALGISCNDNRRLSIRISTVHLFRQTLSFWQCCGRYIHRQNNTCVIIFTINITTTRITTITTIIIMLIIVSIGIIVVIILIFIVSPIEAFCSSDCPMQHW